MYHVAASKTCPTRRRPASPSPRTVAQAPSTRHGRCRSTEHMVMYPDGGRLVTSSAKVRGERAPPAGRSGARDAVAGRSTGPPDPAGLRPCGARRRQLWRGVAPTPCAPSSSRQNTACALSLAHVTDRGSVPLVPREEFDAGGAVPRMSVVARPHHAEHKTHAKTERSQPRSK